MYMIWKQHTAAVLAAAAWQRCYGSMAKWSLTPEEGLPGCTSGWRKSLLGPPLLLSLWVARFNSLWCIWSHLVKNEGWKNWLSSLSVCRNDSYLRGDLFQRKGNTVGEPYRTSDPIHSCLHSLGLFLNIVSLGVCLHVGEPGGLERRCQ